MTREIAARILLFATLINLACNGEPRTPASVVRDSAGIRIVENHAPAWGSGDGWSLDPEPVVEIGAVEGDEDYLLDRVAGVVVLPDGRIVVGNGGDRTLRYYGADGTFLARAAGSGEGPDELSQISGLVFRNGAIHVIQSVGRPVKVFDTEGNFVKAITPPPIPDPERPYRLAPVSGVFADGSLLQQLYMPITPPPGETALDTLVIARGFEDGTADTLMVAPASRSVGHDVASRRSSQEFGPRGLSFATDALYRVWTETAEVKVFDPDGKLQRIIRWDAELHPVTDEDRQNYLDEAGPADLPPGPFREQRAGIANAMIFPEYHPVVAAGLIVDEVGRLWLQRHLPPGAVPAPSSPTAPRVSMPTTTWDVFDADGTWLGPVTLPGRFQPRAIGQDFVAGIGFNDLDVEFVRVYRLRFP